MDSTAVWLRIHAAFRVSSLKREARGNDYYHRPPTEWMARRDVPGTQGETYTSECVGTVSHHVNPSMSNTEQC